MAVARGGRGGGGGDGFLIVLITLAILWIWTGGSLPSITGSSDDAATPTPTSTATAQATPEPTSTEQPAEPTEAPEPEQPVTTGGYDDVLAMLDAIATRTDVRVPEYRRAAFGDGWLDTDGNGCDTRNDILARDLDNITRDSRCRVLTGTLRDLYTGRTIEFVRGEQTSQAVQIDHIVPLAQAWYGGAWAWSDADRQAFANDPVELIAVDGPTNASKSAKALAQWTPPNAAYRCEYVANYVTVTYLYELTLSAADKHAAEQILTSC